MEGMAEDGRNEKKKKRTYINLTSVILSSLIRMKVWRRKEEIELKRKTKKKTRTYIDLTSVLLSSFRRMKKWIRTPRRDKIEREKKNRNKSLRSVHTAVTGYHGAATRDLTEREETGSDSSEIRRKTIMEGNRGEREGAN